MNIIIRGYRADDVPEMNRIWNEVIEDGVAFPQEEYLNEKTGAEFFAAQTYNAVAEDADTSKIYGLYILHPNNIGRCGHICNASYAVSRDSRGLHIGEKLVSDCLIQGKAHGFQILQFNAVVASNIHARHLYERLGFIQLGVIPRGFRMKDGHYEDICPYYHTLLKEVDTHMNTPKEQYIAKEAIVKGNVKLGKDVSVWYHATIRGDSNSITIGDETNIQDNVVVHTENTHPVTIGNGVTIGHSAVVHGCMIGDNSLIGMGAIVLNGAVIGKDCIIGAGALVTQNTHIPDGSLAFGNPAKVIRQVTEEEKAANRANALKYVHEAREEL